MSLQSLLIKRDSVKSQEIILELDRWQLTGLLLGVCVFCAAAFAIGLSVGKSTGRETGGSPVIAGLERKDANAAEKRERQLSLAGVAIGTDRFDANLAQPVADPRAANPAEEARIATHRALQDARALGLRQDAAEGAARAAMHPAVNAAMVAPAPVNSPMAVANVPNRAHSIAVATVTAESAANAMQTALRSVVPSTHKIENRRLVAGGQVLWRVEVGRFESMSEATNFLRDFQRDSGYTATLVDVP